MHGTFGDRARAHSPQLWTSMHGGLGLAAAAGLLLVGGASWLLSRR